MKGVKGANNHRMRSAATLDLPEFIFGDQQLHTRFSLAIELIAAVMLAAPRSIGTERLACQLERPASGVRPLLHALHTAGLIEPDPEQGDAWMRRTACGRTTLADVFCCVADGSPAYPGPCPGALQEVSPERQSVNLLLMQATMAINQVVLTRLRDFDLERLRMLGGSGFDSRYPGLRLRAETA